MFGPTRYSRTYFKHPATQARAYLVDRMSRLRVMRSNGGSVKRAYLSQHGQTLTPVRVARTFIDQVRSRIEDNRELPAVLQGSLPALHSSNRTLRRTLRNLIDKHRLVTAG